MAPGLAFPVGKERRQVSRTSPRLSDRAGDSPSPCKSNGDKLAYFPDQPFDLPHSGIRPSRDLTGCRRPYRIGGVSPAPNSDYSEVCLSRMYQTVTISRAPRMNQTVNLASPA